MFDVRSRAGLARALTLVAACAGARPAAGLSSAPARWTSSTAPTRQCLRYEPDTLHLAGRLKVERRYGPPNYGETPAKDERLRVTFLDLATPVNVCADTAGPDNRDALRNVRRVQLNFATLRPGAAAKSGQRVTVRGTLYRGFSGYHFADAVMNVTALEARP